MGYGFESQRGKEFFFPSQHLGWPYSEITAVHWLGKNPLIIARQRLGRKVNAVTNKYATIE
jgi:hypothetical protein